MSLESKDDKSRTDVEKAMQERREKRAKARAKKEGRAQRSLHSHVKKKVGRAEKAEKKKTSSAAPSEGRKGFRPFACLLLGPIFALFEILLTVLTGNGFLHAGIFHALALGLILGAVCGLLKDKVSLIAEAAVLECVTIGFLVEYFCYNSYRVFMSRSDIATGAGDVVTGFGGVVVGLILRGIPIIILFHVPLALLIWKRKSLGYRKPFDLKPAGVQAAAGIVLLLIGAVFAGIGGREGNFSSDVQTKGL
ncbi:MAG: hypothetical protein IKN20_06285, partial [Firmicutes bacterium]|nr:hypothetical protein [Bacillota bacterium]